MLTPERLRELLHYDPETGVFVWRAPAGRWGSIPAGTAAGTRRTDGYVQIGIEGETYLAHRLAWFYTHGVWPAQIDHEKGVLAGDYFANLRLATTAENAQNYGARKDSRSGARGVYWSPRDRCWYAQITTRGKRQHLGAFDSKELAKEFRGLAAMMLHPFSPEAQA